jgi:hypothetical protein
MTTKERLAKLYAFNAKVDYDIACVEEYLERTKNKFSHFWQTCREQTLPLLRKKRESIIREIAEETDDGEVVRLSREVCND